MHKIKINKVIKSKILNKKLTLIGYGAPAKVTTFSHAFELGKKHISSIVDDNILKQGKYTPGKNIKIINFDDLENLKFDYIIILAWNFAEPIMKSQARYEKEVGQFIVPMPVPKIIEKQT